MKKNKTISIDELYAKYPWRTAKKFVPLAMRHGISADAAKRYLKGLVHDVKVPKAEFINIYSKHPGGYQMDTFINDKSKGGTNYLMFININTRKAYCYPMKGKGASEVAKALGEFVKKEPNVYSITSDQDAAYLSNDVLQFMKDHNIMYHTTEDNNHNVLGIINRFMRTIRDMVGENRFIDEKEMASLIDAYNNSPHRGIDYKAPNEMTHEDEMEYVGKKQQINPYDFKPGERVRIVQAKEPFSKRRNRVSKEAYIVDSVAGNQFLIKSKDESVDKLPGYRLVRTKNRNIAQTLKGGKRGIVEIIKKYDTAKHKYHVVYTDGTEDDIPPRDLREGAPTKLSNMELDFWSKKKNIPESIRRWI